MSLVRGGGYEEGALHQPDGAFVLEMRIEPLPPRLRDVLRNVTGTAGGGTNWPAALAAATSLQSMPGSNP
jgi:hypothetical protein